MSARWLDAGLAANGALELLASLLGGQAAARLSATLSHQRPNRGGVQGRAAEGGAVLGQATGGQIPAAGIGPLLGSGAEVVLD